MSLLKSLFIFGLFFNILLLQGCSHFAPYTLPLSQGTIVKENQVYLLQDGLTKGQVTALLGPVFGANPFRPKHWEYVFYTTDPDFHPDAISHVIIKFDHYGLLASWKISDISVEIKEEEGFFTELLN